MPFRSAVVTMLLAFPSGLAAQLPLRHDVSNPSLAPLPVCQDSLPIVGDTTGLGLVGPALTELHVPPPHPKRMLGTSAEIRVLVDAYGRVDSVVVTGASDSGYVRKLRELIFAKQRYRPAHMNGCRRAAWTMNRITFNR